MFMIAALCFRHFLWEVFQELVEFCDHHQPLLCCEQLMSTRARAFTISSSKPDEWWAIDGQIHRLRPPLSGDLHTIVNMEVPNPRPKPISAKQRLSNRNRLVSQIRIRNDGVCTHVLSASHFQFWKLDVILQNVFNRLAGQSFPL
jgi:hypothetical protein